MVPNKEQLLKFIRSKELVNFSLIAKHFNIQNTTVSDLIKDLEDEKLVEINSFSGSKFVQVKDNKMKKRGQVTTFVIVGIILIAVVAGVLLLNEYVLKSEFEREQSQAQVTNEFLPIKTYFDSCIESVALEGANTIGMQGGYLNIPEDKLPINPVAPFSNKLQVFGNDALEVPYWFYETSNGLQVNQIPSINNMEQDLENYINQNVDNCLINFTEFQDYEVQGFQDINTEVTIQDDKILVRVLSELIVNYKELTQEFDRFLITLDVPLGRLYNKANEIIEKENIENYFEQKTIDMLVLYDQIPYSEINLNCNPRIWATENVKNDLKQIIKTNIEVIKPGAPRKYFDYNLNSENMDINFKYEDTWPFYLEVDGGEQVLKEQSVYGESNPAAVFLRTLFCLNNYHFVYDLKYPVLVNLHQGDYDFQFATLVIIDNNQPRKNKLGIDAPPEENNRICESGTIETTINAVDQETNDFLRDADVKFSCVGTSCNLGKTTSSGFTDKVPACLNALITVSKQGYNEARTTIDTTEKNNLFVYLKPKYKKNLNIKIISSGGERDPLDTEIISFTLTNLDDETQVVFNHETTEVELNEGDYEVQSYIIREYSSGIKLDKQELEYCTEVLKPGLLGIMGFTENKCVTTEIPETTLTQVLVGGAKYQITLTKEQLKNTDSITFYTQFNKVPDNIQELNLLYNEIQTQTNVKQPILR